MFSISTELCNHHQTVILEHFIIPKKTLYTVELSRWHVKKSFVILMKTKDSESGYWNIVKT